MKTVFVETKNFNQLFEDGSQVRIPDYQRPYTWSKPMALALLEDLKVAFAGPVPEREYYLGSVVFYKNRETKTYEIIDGQQRITTLLILKYLLDGPLSEGLNFPLGSHQSVANIMTIRDYIAGKVADFNKPEFQNLLGRLTFTRVVTTTEDAAFTFFDTQNNRGVKLSVTDFLKAYHLREIRSSDFPAQAERLQAAYAQNWEQADTFHAGTALLATLFEKVLWRSRNWKGQNNLSFETQELVLRTFQQGALSGGASLATSIGAGSLNRQAHPHECTLTPLATTSTESLLPYSMLSFSLRQPIHKGAHFFEYTRKYAQIFALLFEGQGKSISLRQLRTFCDDVYDDDMSAYLRQFMQLCLMTYYDCFGQYRLLQAAYCFDYWIGAIRLSKQQVRKESVRAAMRINQYNLLDVIIQAYTPEEIFEVVHGLDELRDIYTQQAGIGDEHMRGVQGRYRRRLLEHFSRPYEQLDSRETWSL